VTAQPTRPKRRFTPLITSIQRLAQGVLAVVIVGLHVLLLKEAASIGDRNAHHNSNDDVENPHGFFLQTIDTREPQEIDYASILLLAAQQKKPSRDKTYPSSKQNK